MKTTNHFGMGRLLALPVEWAPEFTNWRRNRKESAVNTRKDTPTVNGLSQVEERFLRAVIEKPGQPSSKYSNLAGIGTHQAIVARRHLIEAGFLREHRLQTSARGRTSVVLEPLPSALALYAKEVN